MNDTSLAVTIDITPLRGEKTGIGNYVHYTLKYLLSDYNDLHINALSFGLHAFQPDTKQLAQRLKRHIHIPIPTTLLYTWWKYIHYPRIDQIISKNTILHFTNYYLPPVKKQKTVLSIYDLSFMTCPQWVSPKIKRLFQPTIVSSTERADHILTCSQKSKKDIETLLGVAPEKITVAYPGIDNSIFYPIEKEKAKTYIREKYLIKSPFILFVGTIEERKNVLGILKIFEKIHREVPHKLVLIGRKGFRAEEILKEIPLLESNDKIFYLNYIHNHEELRWFYNSADLFLFPSFEEGFGIPPLEAMSCGCPVIVSNQGALPEVVGTAGITLPPTDIEGFAELAISILSDEKKLERMREESIQQSKQFTWSKTAYIHYEIYKKLGQLQ